jgi:hypothetical protein
MLEMVSIDLYKYIYVHKNVLQFKLGDTVDSDGFLEFLIIPIK